MTPREIHRLYCIIRVFLNYGLDELIAHLKIILLIRICRRTVFWFQNRHHHKDLEVAVRLRMALEELGPVWIKFGQMISTRRDILPSQIADQLSILQDHAAPFDGALAKEQIEQSLGGIIESWFDDFDIMPLASASIAQVHTAKLKENGKSVVIKVIRPDILPIIKVDMKLIYRLALWIVRLIPDGHRLHPIEVVSDYEKSLINELNLLREAANAIQLRRNFEKSNMLYVPEVYFKYCRKSMLVMERIYGIPVNDISTLKQHGFNMRLLAERGVHIFFTQVFRDNFFHADMHPGNIFVSYEHPYDPIYISIDYGLVGSLNKEDKRYLAENFIAFFNRDYRKVAQLHITSGWVSSDTNLEEFECAIRAVCEPIFEKPLEKISFGYVLMNLFNTARKFSMEVQPQLILLQKTLIYIEGIGIQLYPQLDLWKTAKPFLEDWIKNQTGIPAMIRTLKEKTPLWIEHLPEIPDLIYDSLRQNKHIQENINHLIRELNKKREQQYQSRYLFRIGKILLLIGITLLITHLNIDILPIAVIIAGLYACVDGRRRLD